jgi:hypothetical protein
MSDFFFASYFIIYDRVSYASTVVGGDAYLTMPLKCGSTY